MKTQPKVLMKFESFYSRWNAHLHCKQRYSKAANTKLDPNSKFMQKLKNGQKQCQTPVFSAETTHPGCHVNSLFVCFLLIYSSSNSDSWIKSYAQLKFGHPFWLLVVHSLQISWWREADFGKSRYTTRSGDCRW